MNEQEDFITEKLGGEIGNQSKHQETEQVIFCVMGVFEGTITADSCFHFCLVNLVIVNDQKRSRREDSKVYLTVVMTKFSGNSAVLFS